MNAQISVIRFPYMLAQKANYLHLITKLSTRPQTQLPEKWKIEYINKCTHTLSAVGERKMHRTLRQKTRQPEKGGNAGVVRRGGG